MEKKLENKKIGFTIGKFAPLHKGHEELIEKGLNEMDEFYILINNTNATSISIEERASWIKEKFPRAKVILGCEPPKQFGMDENSIKIQTNYLKDIFKNIPVTHFYSGEEYGKYVARDLNVEEILVNKDIPISATMIRNDIEYNKNYLSSDVYKKIKNIINKE